MFSNSIDSKANKLKLNVDNYLNSDRKKQGSNQQSMPSLRRPEQPTNYMQMHASAPNTQLVAPPTTTPMQIPPNLQFRSAEIQIKSMTLQGKTFDKGQMSLKHLIKQKSITIFYNDDQIRYKLEVKMIDNNFQLKINQQKGLLQFSFRKVVKYKFFKQDNGQPRWMVTTQIKDEKMLVMFNKQTNKNIKGYFQGIMPQEVIKMDGGSIENEGKIDDKVVNSNQPLERDEGLDADDIINFIMPTIQQLADSQKFRKGIKDMKEEQKIMILTDIFKIKKQYQENLSTDRKKLKCPIQSCQKTYREISQLKTHLKKHPQLNKHGIQLTEFGTFEFSHKALDLSLYLGRMFPLQLKKIIRKMKTKQLAE